MICGTLLDLRGGSVAELRLRGLRRYGVCDSFRMGLLGDE